MAKFKKGDTVRVAEKDGTTRSWIGTEGVVEREVNDYGTVRVRLTKPTDISYEVGFVANLTESGLELVRAAEFPFTFKEIKKGDKIRRTRMYPGGAVEMREGVVNRTDLYFVSEDNLVLAFDEDDSEDSVTLELLERPEPHWAYSKPVGSVALDRRFGASTYRKVSETEWVQHFLIADKAHTSTVEKFANELRNLDPSKLEWLK